MMRCFGFLRRLACGAFLFAVGGPAPAQVEDLGQIELETALARIWHAADEDHADLAEVLAGAGS